MRGLLFTSIALGVVVSSVTAQGAPPGFQPPAVSTKTTYNMKGTLAVVMGENKAEFPLANQLTVTGFGEADATQYALTTEARERSPFFGAARVSFLKLDGGRPMPNQPWSIPLTSNEQAEAEAMAEAGQHLIRSVLFPARLTDEDLTEDRLELDVEIPLIGRVEPITCEVKVDTKPDGVLITRSQIRGRARAAKAGSTDRPRIDVLAWTESFLLDAEGRLKQGKLSYKVQIAFGERLRTHDVDLSLTAGEVEPLSPAQAADIVADRDKLSQIARVPAPTEDAEELKSIQQNLTQSLDELALFEQTRKDSPLAAATAQIREGLEGVLALVDEKVEEVKLLAEFLNKPAPDFTLKNLADEDVTFSEFTRGKVALVSFWGVGCPPCRVEAPHLTELYEKYRDLGFVVVAVNGWDEPKEAVAEFLQSESLRHPVLLTGSQVAEQYRVSALPTSYWVDHQGNVVAHERGFAPGHEKKLEEKIRELLTARNGKAPVVRPARSGN